VGQHNEEILGLLGCTREQMQALQEQGIVGSEHLKK